MSVRRAATIPPVHDSAVAAVQPRSRRRSSTISGSGRSSVAKTCSPRLEVICSARAAAGATPRPARRGCRSRSRSCARRCPSRRRAGPPGLGEQVGHVRLADPVGADQPPPARLGAGKERRKRRMLGSHLPQPPQLGRNAREHDHPRGADGHHEPGRGARDPQYLGAHGNVRLLAVAGVEPAAVEPVAHGDLIGPAVDLGQHVRIELELDAGDLGQGLDRAVVVGRPEAARGDHQVGRLEQQPHARADVRELVTHHQRARHARTPAARVRRPDATRSGRRSPPAGARCP